MWLSLNSFINSTWTCYFEMSESMKKPSGFIEKPLPRFIEALASNLPVVSDLAVMTDRLS